MGAGRTHHSQFPAAFGAAQSVPNLFDHVNEHLASRALKVAGGAIVDATIIAAPNSTKNAAKVRDPKMHQPRKGQQWYFG